MPRAIGQIDTRKSEAILEAATEVLAARGLSASIEEVARRAGVSKQTIYNHFGSKTELLRVLMDKRRSRVTAALDDAPADRPAEETLALYARSILETVLSNPSIQLMRMGVAGSVDMPEVSRALYDAGPRASIVRLAAFLESRPGTELEIPDPAFAAEIFSGMTIGRLQTRLLFGLPSEIDPSDIPRQAREVARRFVRAFQPVQPAERR